jgi:N-acetylglutamate synthase-like GNAT family acetyltransferase
MTPRPSYRVAAPGDEDAILKIFAEVAPAVPTAVRKGTDTMIRDWVAVGRSWVAVNADCDVIGYGLVWPGGDPDAIELTYLGVTEDAQSRGICSGIISKLKESGIPIKASVRHDNTSSMADRFSRLGFIETEVRESETKFRWDKPPTL